MFLFFCFPVPAPTDIYTLSLHDALPISYTLDYLSTVFTDFVELHGDRLFRDDPAIVGGWARLDGMSVMVRSEEHTSELQSPVHLVCRLLLEKKKKTLIEIVLYI